MCRLTHDRAPEKFPGETSDTMEAGRSISSTPDPRTDVAAIGQRPQNFRKKKKKKLPFDGSVLYLNLLAESLVPSNKREQKGPGAGLELSDWGSAPPARCELGVPGGSGGTGKGTAAAPRERAGRRSQTKCHLTRDFCLKGYFVVWKPVIKLFSGTECLSPVQFAL